MPPKSKWSSFHRGVLTDRSISCCSQNTDSDPAASKPQNMPSACLQCWNSLGWEVAPRAWDRCDLGTTAEGSKKTIKFRHCSDCVSSSSVGKTCPKPLYSKFQKSFERFSMCSPWHSETPSEPVASLWTKPFASCLKESAARRYQTFRRTASYNDTIMYSCMYGCMYGWMDVCMHVCMYVCIWYHITHCKGLAKTKSL